MLTRTSIEYKSRTRVGFKSSLKQISKTPDWVGDDDA